VRVHVLGSAAGGGLPQWNCGCENCRRARAGAPDIVPRTQESVAVTSDGVSWVLLNASPDVRHQLSSTSALHPQAPRHSPVVAVVLTSGELDHVLGLLSLRESHPLAVYATESVRDGFTRNNALGGALASSLTWRRLRLGHAEDVCDGAGRATGLVVDARPVPGKVPRHLEGWRTPTPEDVVALRVRDGAGGPVLAYCPGAGRIDDAVRDALADAACVFLDGTFWSSDELTRQGLGTRRAEDMAHAPLGGPDGSLAALDGLVTSRRILIHMNNTNPVLREDAPERAEARGRGWEVAHDGMELRL
jgi:pyrroloquinoline quinone biosynthesis protein B